MDGCFPDWNFPVATADEHGHILVDDADWYVHWALDRCANQLVVDQERHKGAMRLTNVNPWEET